METNRLSSKGQMVLPKEFRDRHGWGPGTGFEVLEAPEGVLLRPLREFPESRIEDVFGCLRHRGKAKTVSAIKRGVAREVKKRRDRGRY